MDVIELRRRLLQPHTLTIGGLPVLINNFRFSAGNGSISANGEADPDYFITGWYDTGSTGSKSYRFCVGGTYAYNMTARWYNDKTGSSYDFWVPNQGSERDFSGGGRFIAWSLKKSEAANMWLYDTTNNKYVIKGINVT